MMRSLWILLSLLVSTAATAAEETAAATGITADLDYIPPSTAIFSGLDNSSPPENPAGSSGQRMSQSINEALNIAPKSTQNRNNAAGPKPLDVAPLAVPGSPDKQQAGIPAGGSPQKENIPAELLHSSVNPTGADDLPIIEIYSQEELISLINDDKHLQRVAKTDECQLVKDIEARARAVMIPAYQYLWGDMLLTGTCTGKNVDVGIEYLWKAAQQGLPAALEHLARYYAKGRYVQRDAQQAAIFMHEAAAQGYLKAQIGWVSMLVDGLGSPLDYEEAYSWLHHSVIADDKQHKRAASLLARLSQKMPPNIVKRAKIYRWQ